MNTLLEKKNSRKHRLYVLLKDALQLSDGQLCEELDVRGHDVPPDKLAAMMAGFEPMPESIEKALKHVGAEHLFFAEHVLDSVRVQELVGPWCAADDRPAIDCRPAIDKFTDVIDALDD